MPLVTITAKPAWSPNTEDPLGGITTQGAVVYSFGAALPALLSEKAHLMRLPEFPEIAVQVKFENFGKFDINAPDIWLLIHIGEELKDEVHQDVESVIYDIMKTWSDDNHYGWFKKGGPRIAIDITHGRLHGRFFRGSELLTEW